MVISNEKIKHFKEEGYFILDRFFSESEMNELTSRIDGCVEEHVEAMKAKDNQEGISRANEITFTAHMVKKDAYAQKFCAQDKFVDFTTKLLGPEVALFWDQAVYKRPETDKDFPWHQDNGYGLVLSEEYVTCWIALEDATIDNGCIWIMPRSHKQGIVEHKSTPIGWQCYFGEDPGVPVPLKKGSMVVFSSLLFHRSGPNISQDIRKGYIVQYFPTHTLNVKSGKPFKKMVIARNGKAELDAAHIQEQGDHH